MYVCMLCVKALRLYACMYYIHGLCVSSIVCLVLLLVIPLLQDYESGRLLSGNLKKQLIAVLQDIITRHQERRALVTDDVVQRFMTPRALNFGKKAMAQQAS